MEQSRIVAVIQPLLGELAPAAHTVDQVLQALNNSADREHLNESRAALEKLLLGAQSNNWVPSWRRVVETLGARRLHGAGLWNRVRGILDDPDMRREHVIVLLEGVKSDILAASQKLRALDHAFTATGLTRYNIPADKCEIGALYTTAAIDIDGFARELHELDRHMRTFAELGRSPGALPLFMLQTSSFDVFLLASPLVGSVVAGVIVGVVNLLKSLAEIRKLQAETKKLSAEAAEILAKQASGMKEKGLQDITRAALVQSNSNDAARANELAIATRQAVVYVESKVQLNVVFEVRMGDDIASSKSEPSDIPEKAVEQINAGGSALAEFDAQRLVPLLGPEGSPRTKSGA